MRSLEDLIDYQEDNHGNSCCQVGNGKISTEGLAYYQRSSAEISDCQVGNEMGSLDLIDCQVGSRKLPYYQVGMGGKINSEESLDKQGVLTGED
jgi:hypothetical protein